MEFMKQYEVLFKKAKSDLKASKNLFEDFENGDNELDLEIVMFHLQQCAEKLLKSLLAFNQYHFTKTHNIKELLNAIKARDIKTIPDLAILIPLAYFAVEGRYAIIHDDLDDVDKYIVVLNTLVEFVKHEIMIDKNC